MKIITMIPITMSMMTTTMAIAIFDKKYILVLDEDLIGFIKSF